MASPDFHLAQVNIARMKEPLNHPVMAEFVAQLATVNALADQSPGFVWRLQEEAGNATSLQVFDDPLILVNLSVWESAEALQAFVCQSRHVGVLANRAQWFERMPEAHYALWWVPAGHRPSVAEAKEKLEELRAHGESAQAFTFRRVFPIAAQAQAG